MQQCLLVGEECLGQSEAARLFDEVIEHAPAGIAVPAWHGVADHLVHAGAIHEGGGHAIGTVDVAHQAVADRQIDLGIVGPHGEPCSAGVEAEELAVFALECAVAIAIADLPIAFGGMARSDEQISVIGVERIDEGLGGIDGPLRFLRRFAGLLTNHLARIELAIPDALIA